jgi:CubicO group peptidase (beta-lactamase class C family)
MAVAACMCIAPAQGIPRPDATVDRALDGLDEFITSGMTEWQVPGLAIGVIADGKVRLAKAYGKRDVERNLPATPRTVMAIASASKSFTAMLIGMLVDEKKLEWDRPVRDYLPDFRMSDEYAAAHTTPRDLLSHRSGLPQHDRVWKGRAFTRQQLFERLRYLEPNTTFRDRFQYQNLMVVTAGVLVERVTGKTWDTLVRERLFTPLGMAHSSTSVTEIVKEDDFAQPYMPMEGKAVRVPFLNIDAVGPAGGINSSVEDMLKYIQFRMDLGSVGGRQLVSPATAKLMETAQISAPTPVDTDEIDFGAYGLGLSLESYKGHKMVHHSGGIDGFIAEMSWMPRERIGLVILTNRTGNPLGQIVSRQVYDLLLRLPSTDWKARWRRTVEQAAARADAARQKLEQERIAGTWPAHDLTAYAGVYEHPGYGRMTVRSNGGTVEIAFDKFVVRLKPYHHDVFEVNTQGEIPGIVPVRGLVKFQANSRGTIDRLLIPFEPLVPDIVFERR